jgi:hypothetical protein
MLIPASAIAAPPTGLQLTPENDSIPAGYCNAFTATLLGATQTDITGQTVDVEIRDADTGQTQNAQSPVRFCTPDATATPSNYNQTGPNIRPTNPALNLTLNGDSGCEQFAADYGCNGTLSGETGTTNTSGQITFGVISNESGTYNVTAYYDTNGNDIRDVGEPGDSSAKTFTQPTFIPQCSDQADNDGDTKIDFGTGVNNDPGCTSNSDNDETDPAPVSPDRNQCEDGFDNDGDGLIDFGSDGGCQGRTDNDETGNGNRRLATAVTIRYNKPVHGFKGTLANAHKKCRINRKVTLFRKRKGPDVKIRSTRSTDKGTYIIKKRNVRGKTWYTKAAPKQFPRQNGGTVFCLKGRSVNLTMRARR